jgi:hypothetical protein
MLRRGCCKDRSISELRVTIRLVPLRYLRGFSHHTAIGIIMQSQLVPDALELGQQAQLRDLGAATSRAQITIIEPVRRA